MPKAEKHKWTFAPRFRRNAFGWRSQPAIQRVKEAISEIKKTARKDPVLGAAGAVLFFEKVSPALAHVDSSSGAIGNAVNRAIRDLVPIIAEAPADAKTRAAWLKRLWQAHAEDRIPYIESLADHWGELCASQDVASGWADDLVDVTRRALNPDRKLRDHFHGTSACLSALFYAERYAELIDVLEVDTLWAYRRWAVMARAAMGKKAEAIRYAEGLRGPWASDLEIDQLCEQILLSSGLADEAYKRYGLTANRAGTYLAWFRAVAKKYPHKAKAEILDDLVAETPGEEGKWFAAAKSAGLYDQAVALAKRTPCDPRTLTRAARDFARKNPAFAVEAGFTALHWLVEGYGYEITGADVRNAYDYTMEAAEHLGSHRRRALTCPRPRRRGNLRRTLRDSDSRKAAGDLVRRRPVGSSMIGRGHSSRTRVRYSVQAATSDGGAGSRSSPPSHIDLRIRTASLHSLSRASFGYASRSLTLSPAR